MNKTPKRNKLPMEDSDALNVTPTNRLKLLKVNNSIDEDPFSNNPAAKCDKSISSPGETRRGRPRAENLPSLIQEGSTSPSSIKCKFCSRVFPREKSLQAHERIHKGEKPYACDFPRCNRRFVQSGQLKTHKRLHTGEKPFVCTAPNCTTRFTHPNRFCPEHPNLQLKRYHSSPQNVIDKKYDEAHNAEIRQWIFNNIDKKEINRSLLEDINTTPKKSRVKFDLPSSNECSNDYIHQSITDEENSREGIRECTEPLPSSCSESSENDVLICRSLNLPANPPKKRWLHASQEQLYDVQAPLAVPLNWDEDKKITGQLSKLASSTISSNMTDKQDLNKLDPIVIENQKRPTVLVCVPGSTSKEITSEDMEGAIALVQLKKAHCNHNYRI